MDTIHYRKAEAKDIDALVEIWKSGQHNSIGNLSVSYTAREIKNFFLECINHQTTSHKIYVRDEDDMPVGFCAVLPYHPNPVWNKRLAFMSLYVSEAYQDKLIGFRLMQYTIAKTSRSDIEMLFATIVNTNTKAIKISQKLGYKLIHSFEATKHIAAHGLYVLKCN